MPVVDPSIPTLANAGFEDPGLAVNDWQQGLVNGWSGSNAWGFANGSGPWGSGGHSGTQYAYVQASSGGPGVGRINQTVDGFTPGAKYQISFWMRHRTGGDIVFGVDPNVGTPMRVYLNDVLILGPTAVPGERWSQYTTRAFVATQTSYTISFVPDLARPGNRTDLIDDVTVERAVR